MVKESQYLILSFCLFNEVDLVRMSNMDELMKRVTASYLKIGQPVKLVLGLSGGADSVALALLLLELRKQFPVSLACVHVHHGLRDNADLDAAFVRAFCEEHGLPLIVEYVNVSCDGNVEANARVARYQAFAKAMSNAENEWLVLGHHLDDQAETMLMRLMVGTGNKGLASMREVSGHIWRPLLGTRRHDIIQYLTGLGQSWREDESNEDERFLRNAIRKRLMPIMTDICPSSVRNLGRTSVILSDEEVFWSDYVTNWLQANACLQAPLYFVMTQPLSSVAVAAQRRILRGLCETADVVLDFEQTERMRLLLLERPGSSANLSGGVKAYRGWERLHVVKPDAELLPLGQLQETNQPKAGNRRIECFDGAMLAGAQLRYRQPGDRIAPLGLGGTQSLKEYLINRKVDRPLRDMWPVLARGPDILWVVGVGLAQTAAVTGATTKPVTLCYRGRLPDEIDANSNESE